MLPGFVSTVVVGRRGLCRMASLQKVVVPAQGEHRSTAIFLHGLGDSGEGWQPLVPYMTSSHIKFILPSAPYRRLTMFGGEAVPSWTDVKNLEEGTPEDKEGFIECVGMVNKIIQEEKAAGIDPSSIVVGGFSQGGAVALTSLARLEEKIAGIVALSTWLPLRESYPEELSESNKETPILMCHGGADQVVPFARGKLSADLLSDMGRNVEFKRFPNMPHSADMEEMKLVQDFLRNVLTK
mmetsp:Transcript_2174/g.8524  ORF Transcript_2174/g.8524 Transcript_2174/m.8524 type:complete len:239 (-) Transcript_2174:404-1120(-)